MIHSLFISDAERAPCHGACWGRMDDSGVVSRQARGHDVQASRPNTDNGIRWSSWWWFLHHEGQVQEPQSTEQQWEDVIQHIRGYYLKTEPDPVAMVIRAIHPHPYRQKTPTCILPSNDKRKHLWTDLLYWSGVLYILWQKEVCH